MSLRQLDLKIPLLLVLLSIVPLLAGIFRLVGLFSGAHVTPENARFFAMPLPVTLHIIFSLLFCVLGAFQFSQAIRLRWTAWHRKAGWLLILSGLISASSGLWMTVFYPIPEQVQGPILYVTRLFVSTGMFVAILFAFRFAIKRKINQHRAWIIRAYALGQGAGTQVIIMLPPALIAGDIFGLKRDLLMTSAWIINLMIAERIIRR